MAVPELRGTARLLNDPRTGTSANGTPWTQTVVKFQTWTKTDTGWDEGEGVIASVVAFDDTATSLARFAKGDQVGLHGTVKAAIYRDQPQLAVTASDVWTPEKAATTSARVKSSTTPAIKPGTAGLAAARQAASASLRDFRDRRTGSAA